MCVDDAIPLGVAFPAIVKSGRTLSAANVSKKWIGFEAEKFFEDGLGRDIHFANDADVAGVAEMRYGAARGAGGLDDPHDARHRHRLGDDLQRRADPQLRTRPPAARQAREGRRGVRRLLGDGARGASAGSSGRERLQWYYSYVEFLFTPDLFIVGGGVSKHADKFLPLLKLNTPIVARGAPQQRGHHRGRPGTRDR